MGDYWFGDDPKKWSVYKEAGEWVAHPPLQLTHRGWKPYGFSTHALACGFAIACAYKIAPFSQTYRVG